MPSLVLVPPSPPDVAALARVPGAAEVLLEHRALARRGRLDDVALLTVADELASTDLRRVLVWDVLADDAQITEGLAVLRRLGPDRLDAIRVQDVGIAAVVREHLPDHALQWIVETGNHNLTGLAAWVEAFRPTRLIVSNEIPVEALGRMRSSLDVPVEVQVLGRLLLYYTPRRLVSPHEPEAAGYLARWAVSEDDGKRFPIVENDHGTFMYYEKDLFLLPYLAQLDAHGIDHARLDCSFFAPGLIDAVAGYLHAPDGTGLDAVKAYLGPKLTRGFFKSNRTDKQLSRLKNPSLGLREDMAFLGQVVDTRKKRYLALSTQVPVSEGDEIVFAIPEGELIRHRIGWIRDPLGDRHARAARPGLWLIDHCKRVSSGSRVYFAG